MLHIAYVRRIERFRMRKHRQSRSRIFRRLKNQKSAVREHGSSTPMTNVDIRRYGDRHSPLKPKWILRESWSLKARLILRRAVIRNRAGNYHCVSGLILLLEGGKHTVRSFGASFEGMGADRSIPQAVPNKSRSVEGKTILQPICFIGLCDVFSAGKKS